MCGTVEYEMYQHARERARERGLPFTIAPSDIQIPETCPVLGIPLRSDVGVTNDASPTLDRMRPSDGYARGNVVVMSHLANRIKGDSSSDQVLAVAEWMESLGL